ncbi:MAG: nitroreductase family protein [Qingshengfaniella sp.]
MPDRNQPALDFLLTRRSRPAKTLTAPWPTRTDLDPILTAAARSPDHGMLTPWRFIILTGPATDRMATTISARAEALKLDPATAGKGIAQFAQSGCCVVAVESPKPSPKIPALEQTYSTGAVCLSLLNAALAAGWGANWLTGWIATDRPFLEDSLHLSPGERVAGFIHIGTEGVAPSERPRPDLAQITTWIDA